MQRVREFLVATAILATTGIYAAIEPKETSPSEPRAPASIPITPVSTAVQSQPVAAAKEDGIKWSDWIVAFATLVTAGFTWQLWVSTDKLWSEAKKAGETADLTAKAALTSVQAALAAERAYVFADVIFESMVAAPSGNWFKATVIFRNYGKTPAIMTMLRSSAVVREHTPQELAHFAAAEAEVPPSLAIAPGGEYGMGVRRQLGDAEFSAIKDGNQRMYVLGTFRYDDVMGQHHETGFCWDMRTEELPYRFAVTSSTPLNIRS